MVATAYILSMPITETTLERSRFEQCYASHKEAVYRWSMRYACGQKELAKDLSHDVFVRLWEHLPRLMDRTDLGPWLFRVTANVAITRIRRDSALSRLKGVLNLTADEQDEDGSPDDALQRQEDSRAAMKMLSQLPAKERVVLCMKLLDGKTQREISEALDMSEGYVSKLVARGIERVRASGWEVPGEA